MEHTFEFQYIVQSVDNPEALISSFDLWITRGQTNASCHITSLAEVTIILLLKALKKSIIRIWDKSWFLRRLESLPVEIIAAKTSLSLSSS